MTTVRLVREAEIQLRRPCLHLIPLELRTLTLQEPATLPSATADGKGKDGGRQKAPAK